MSTQSAKKGKPDRQKDQATPQLSCEVCRERKIKCDKRLPCTNCVSSGVTCVPIYRLRLPRGRHAHRLRRTSPSPSAPVQLPSPAAVDEGLSERIRRLEALVGSMGAAATRAGKADGGSREQSVDGSDTQVITSARPSPTALCSPISTDAKKRSLSMQRPDDFWADLVDEIHGLRGVIELAQGEADEDISSIQATDPAQSDSANDGTRVLGLWGSTNPPPVPRQFAASRAALSRDKAAVSQLCQVYLRQVDPIIKILHRPSLNKWILQGEGYLGYADGHASVEALSSAVCYSAACSMTENQSRSLFHASKSSITADCRRATELALERSGLLTTQDITVLQAFVLYLVARRSEERGRAVWTLIAVAVRIAKALCLYEEPNVEAGRGETFFDQQMRKRLWLTICLMDLQASFGQASEPLVSCKEAASSLNLPRHINDSDFDPTTRDPVPDREGLTDTTFALITYHAQLGGRLLNFAASEEEKKDGDNGGSTSASGSGKNGPSSSLNAATSDRETRQQYVRQFEQAALGLLHFCDPESSPFAWFTWHGTQCLVAGTRLAALRPLRRSRAGHQAPPPRMESDTELLRLTLHALEKVQLMNTDARGEGFRWYVTIPWHALAIAIAECYVCTDVALVRRAWPLVEASFQNYEAAMARGTGGELRGPLAKLMRRTREKLAGHLQQQGGGPNNENGTNGNSGFSNTNSNTNSISNSNGGNSGSALTGSFTLLPTPTLSMNEGLTAPAWSLNGSPTSPDLAFDRTHASSTLMFAQQTYNPSPLLWDNSSSLATRVSTSGTGPPPLQDGLDPSWKMWEEFLSGISPDDAARPGTFSFENNLGSY